MWGVRACCAFKPRTWDAADECISGNTPIDPERSCVASNCHSVRHQCDRGYS